MCHIISTFTDFEHFQGFSRFSKFSIKSWKWYMFCRNQNLEWALRFPWNQIWLTPRIDESCRICLFGDKSRIKHVEKASRSSSLEILHAIWWSAGVGEAFSLSAEMQNRHLDQSSERKPTYFNSHESFFYQKNSILSWIFRLNLYCILAGIDISS